MTCDIQSAGTIELYFYGELAPDERAGLQAHLNQCAECRHALEDLSIIRAALATRPDVATPRGGDWSAFMERLDSSIQRLSEDSTATGTSRWAFPLRRRAVAFAAMSALLTLVTASVLVLFNRDGAVPQAPPQATVPSPTAQTQAVNSTTAAPDPGLLSLSGSHFERSKLVVLGLATRDSGSLRPSEWSRERERAAALLHDTRLYRMAAEERGMNTLAGVMRDLELVLLQTSMSEESDPASIEQLQRLIRRRDLLTKMNVVSTAGP